MGCEELLMEKLIFATFPPYSPHILRYFDAEPCHGLLLRKLAKDDLPIVSREKLGFSLAGLDC